MSLKLKVHQISNATQLGYPNWYSSVSYEKKVMDLDALAQHMADHNTPYSKGVIKGILTDMVSCIREQALLGRKIRIDGLALLKLGVDSYGAETYKEAKQRSMIKRIKLMIFPNGDFTSSELADAEYEWVDDYNPLNVRNFKITAVANDASMGSVTGSGTYQEDTEVTLVAKAKSGFVFSKWQDDDVNATRVITVTEAKQYVATFVKEAASDEDDSDSDGEADAGTTTSKVHLTLACSPAGAGTLSGEGDFDVNAEATISAVAASDSYTFQRWSDNVTSATRTVTMDADKTLTAYFTETGSSDDEGSFAG